MKRLLEAYLKLYEEGIEISPKVTTMGIGLSITDQRTGQSMFLLEEFRGGEKSFRPVSIDLDTGKVSIEPVGLVEQFKQGDMLALNNLIFALNPIVEEVIATLVRKHTHLRSGLFLKVRTDKLLPALILAYEGLDEDLEGYIQLQLFKKLEEGIIDLQKIVN